MIRPTKAKGSNRGGRSREGASPKERKQAQNTNKQSHKQRIRAEAAERSRLLRKAKRALQRKFGREESAAAATPLAGSVSGSAFAHSNSSRNGSGGDGSSLLLRTSAAASSRAEQREAVLHGVEEKLSTWRRRRAREEAGLPDDEYDGDAVAAAAGHCYDSSNGVSNPPTRRKRGRSETFGSSPIDSSPDRADHRRGSGVGRVLTAGCKNGCWPDVYNAPVRRWMPWPGRALVEPSSSLASSYQAGGRGGSSEGAPFDEETEETRRQAEESWEAPWMRGLVGRVPQQRGRGETLLPAISSGGVGDGGAPDELVDLMNSGEKQGHGGGDGLLERGNPIGWTTPSADGGTHSRDGGGAGSGAAERSRARTLGGRGSVGRRGPGSGDTSGGGGPLLVQGGRDGRGEADGFSDLHYELVRFEEYVSLTPAEVAARESLVASVGLSAEEALGPGATARAFGSYGGARAGPGSRCFSVFLSDVDISVRPPADTAVAHYSQKGRRPRYTPPARSSGGEFLGLSRGSGDHFEEGYSSSTSASSSSPSSSRSSRSSRSASSSCSSSSSSSPSSFSSSKDRCDSDLGSGSDGTIPLRPIRGMSAHKATAAVAAEAMYVASSCSETDSQKEVQESNARSCRQASLSPSPFSSTPRQVGHPEEQARDIASTRPTPAAAPPLPGAPAANPTEAAVAEAAACNGAVSGGSRGRGESEVDAGTVGTQQTEGLENFGDSEPVETRPVDNALGFYIDRQPDPEMLKFAALESEAAVAVAGDSTNAGGGRDAARSAPVGLEAAPAAKGSASVPILAGEAADRLAERLRAVSERTVQLAADAASLLEPRPSPSSQAGGGGGGVREGGQADCNQRARAGGGSRERRRRGGDISEEVGGRADEPMGLVREHEEGKHVGSLQPAFSRGAGGGAGGGSIDLARMEDDSQAARLQAALIVAAGAAARHSRLPAGTFTPAGNLAIYTRPELAADGGRGSWRGGKAGGKARAVTGLRKVGKRLLKMPWVENFEFRSRAKVPIIAMLDARGGVNCDVAWGGDGGAGDCWEDPAAAPGPEYFAKMFPGTFRPLALFLKVFMHQRGLDKPFTGGLGSFKIYALLASHLRACGCGRAQQQQHDLGDLLLGFLRRYSYASKEGLTPRTRLQIEGLTVDLGSAFRALSASKDFGRAFDALTSAVVDEAGNSQSKGADKSNDGSGNQSCDGSVGVAGGVGSRGVLGSAQSRGVGRRGRGRELMLPAWMSQPQQLREAERLGILNDDIGSNNNGGGSGGESRDVHGILQGRGAGRRGGRRDPVVPAWMPPPQQQREALGGGDGLFEYDHDAPFPEGRVRGADRGQRQAQIAGGRGMSAYHSELPHRGAGVSARYCSEPPFGSGGTGNRPGRQPGDICESQPEKMKGVECCRLRRRSSVLGRVIWGSDLRRERESRLAAVGSVKASPHPACPEPEWHATLEATSLTSGGTRQQCKQPPRSPWAMTAPSDNGSTGSNTGFVLDRRSDGYRREMRGRGGGRHFIDVAQQPHKEAGLTNVAWKRQPKRLTRAQKKRTKLKKGAEVMEMRKRRKGGQENRKGTTPPRKASRGSQAKAAGDKRKGGLASASIGRKKKTKLPGFE